MSITKKVITIIVNAWLVCSALVITISNLASGNQQLDDNITGFTGTENLRFYTVDSNLLLAICAGIFIILLLNKRQMLPHWFRILFLMAAVSVAVTFVTVACFLAPEQAIAGRGYFSLFTHSNLYFHFINPVLGILDFILLIPRQKYSIKQSLWGIIPTAIYSLVYVGCVVIFRVWPDFYYFTFGGHDALAPIVVVVFLLLSFGLSVLLTRLHNRAFRKQS